MLICNHQKHGPQPSCDSPSDYRIAEKCPENDIQFAVCKAYNQQGSNKKDELTSFRHTSSIPFRMAHMLYPASSVTTIDQDQICWHRENNPHYVASPTYPSRRLTSKSAKSTQLDEQSNSPLLADHTRGTSHLLSAQLSAAAKEIRRTVFK